MPPMGPDMSAADVQMHLEAAIAHRSLLEVDLRLIITTKALPVVVFLGRRAILCYGLPFVVLLYLSAPRHYHMIGGTVEYHPILHALGMPLRCLGRPLKSG